ncbi:MAG: recombinase family protein [Rhodobacteraceae bacterium]|nr:recombinase family protein [Paracoccaceae bacterium]
MSAEHLPLSDPTIPKAVIYCRVSSAKQVEEGHGLESQATRCREYAERKRYEVIKTFYERGVSGGLMDRPSFNKLIAFIKASKLDGVVVIIDDISRFARDIESHWTLRRTLKDIGGKLESPSITFGEDSDSVLIENLLASVSQHQRQKNREQTTNRMRARTMNGYWCFPAPPGFKYARVAGHGKLLVRDEPLATIIADALEGFATGRYASQSEVKSYLESEPAFASRFPSGFVRYEEVIRLLTRPHYAGYIEVPAWGIPLMKGKHEGLITLETFTRIQERIKEGARVAARADINKDFPLRGFALCGDCEKPLTSCWSKSKTGDKHPYYMCFNKGCGSYRKSIRRDVIEGEFADLLQEVVPSKANLSLANRMFSAAWNQRQESARENAALYANKIGELDKQVETLLSRLMESDTSTVVKAYEKKIAELEQQKLLLAEKAEQTGKPRAAFEQLFELAIKFPASLWKVWESGRFDLQRLVLRLAFAERLPYSRETGFRTPELSFLFKVLGGESVQDCKMAERVGFEPTVRFHAR